MINELVNHSLDIQLLSHNYSNRKLIKFPQMEL